MSDKVYGFFTDEYFGGIEVETLQVGDGKALFHDISFEDGTVSIGMSYGNGTGIGTKNLINKPTDASMGIKFQVKFDSQLSIDAMIETLLRCKNKLSV